MFVGCNPSFQLDNSTGSADLVISSIVSSNPLFSIGLTSFPITIPAGSSLTLPITFTFTGTGTEVSDITIENNDCNDASYSFSIENENISSCEMQCPQNEVISGVVYSNINPEIIIVEDWITAENITVDTDANVEYSAGQYVELNPHFEVKLSSIFEAFIAGCTP